ncbi:hypothetical protein [Leptothoe sp. PORK10 BA2]|uniref:hypothetical protein n=1 Tax=Leptothoe sp. PORK10 BA2 TaxID=3110254 RepID=UPI002B21C24A|nr:hypothetical protein [Leptothoe sp. PORK10 BA2]MEA5463874.1 hypothetical protein [Leptothoe sp. PORK10 BA2]
MNRIDKRKLERYEMVVYISLLLLAVVLGFVGNGINQEVIKAITINLASELLAVGILFFFINRMFLLGDSDDLPRKLLDVLTRDNSPLIMKFDLFKSELYARIQQMSKQIGEEVNTKLDLDSNELYSFHGLLGKRRGMTFQNFRVSRDADCENTNAVSFLWADTFYGNSVNAKVISKEVEPFLRIEFQSFEPSLGCNIAVRSQDQRAIELRGQELNYLCFYARIPQEALQSPDLLQDVGIAIRLVNGKCQHWDYGDKSGEYRQFSIKGDGTWTVVCIDLQDKKRWSHFTGDGNQYINQDEMSNADFSVVSAIVIKVGKFLGIRGELGYGKGMVDIKDIRFSPDLVKMS